MAVEKIECPACLGQTNKDSGTCEFCGIELENHWNAKNITKQLPQGLRIAGWAYFILNVIGAIYLFANATVDIPGQGDPVANYLYIVLALSLIFTGTIILLLCMGIARIIEQNVYMIRNLTEN